MWRPRHYEAPCYPRRPLGHTIVTDHTYSSSKYTDKIYFQHSGREGHEEVETSESPKHVRLHPENEM
jgi:hypothetical protein